MIYFNGEKVELGDKLPKEKRPVIFLLHERLISQVKTMRNDSVVWLKKSPGDLTIPSFYTSSILSETEGQLRYATSSRNQQIGSGFNTLYKPDNIEFVGGKLEVPASRPDLIWWLRNHPNNASNEIYEDENVAKPHNLIFFEKDIKKEKEAAYNSIKAETETKHSIFKMSAKETQDVYESLGVFAEPYDVVGKNGAQSMLIAHAGMIGYDKFDNYIKSQRRVFNNIIKNAIDLDIIEFKETSNARFWQWVGGKQFTTIPKGIDEMEHLYIQVMKKDSTGLLNSIKEQVETKLAEKDK